MSTPAEPTLEQKRAALRSELRGLRRELAAQLLAPQAAVDFPRSLVMRLLIRQPALAGWLVTRFAGPRVGVPVTGLLLAIRHLTAGQQSGTSRKPSRP